ncbi:hypothetical protein [Ochrobactrum sp. A-1]|uniref:hypothetical protein n=1 Tax=Ochrobactrum sp. A-1 TaxID=2920940 RepID=UPI001F0AC7F3|nr:hypothetical protein [Ochrobactrum sp. A-1]
MTIPVVKTAIAPKDGMPAHPAPNAKYFKYTHSSGDTVMPNTQKITVMADIVNSSPVSMNTSLIQIFTPEDVLFLANLDWQLPQEQLNNYITWNGMPLRAGGYYSFSVDPGTMLFFKSVTTDTEITVLEG